MTFYISNNTKCIHSFNQDKSDTVLEFWGDSKINQNKSLIRAPIWVGKTQVSNNYHTWDSGAPIEDMNEMLCKHEFSINQPKIPQHSSLSQKTQNHNK